MSYTLSTYVCVLLLQLVRIYVLQLEYVRPLVTSTACENICPTSWVLMSACHFYSLLEYMSYILSTYVRMSLLLLVRIYVLHLEYACPRGTATACQNICPTSWERMSSCHHLVRIYVLHIRYISPRVTTAACESITLFISGTYVRVSHRPLVKILALHPGNRITSPCHCCSWWECSPSSRVLMSKSQYCSLSEFMSFISGTFVPVSLLQFVRIPGYVRSCITSAACETICPLSRVRMPSVLLLQSVGMCLHLG